MEFEGWDDLIKVNEPSPSTLPGMGLESPSSYFINHPVENGYMLVGPNWETIRWVMLSTHPKILCKPIQDPKFIRIKGTRRIIDF